jgi:hypothetical protein
MKQQKRGNGKNIKYREQTGQKKWTVGNRERESRAHRKLYTYIYICIYIYITIKKHNRGIKQK